MPLWLPMLWDPIPFPQSNKARSDHSHTPTFRRVQPNVGCYTDKMTTYLPLSWPALHKVHSPGLCFLVGNNMP